MKAWESPFTIPNYCRRKFGGLTFFRQKVKRAKLVLGRGSTIQSNHSRERLCLDKLEVNRCSYR